MTKEMLCLSSRPCLEIPYIRRSVSRGFRFLQHFRFGVRDRERRRRNRRASSGILISILHESAIFHEDIWESEKNREN